jgi:hypothetical protein
VVIEEVAQLRDTNSNSNLSQDLDGKSDDPLLSLSGSLLVPYRTLIHWLWMQGRA